MMESIYKSSSSMTSAGQFLIRNTLILYKTDQYFIESSSSSSNFQTLATLYYPQSTKTMDSIVLYFQSNSQIIVTDTMLSTSSTSTITPFANMESEILRDRFVLTSYTFYNGSSSMAIFYYPIIITIVCFTIETLI